MHHLTRAALAATFGLVATPAAAAPQTHHVGLELTLTFAAPQPLGVGATWSMDLAPSGSSDFGFDPSILYGPWARVEWLGFRQLGASAGLHGGAGSVQASLYDTGLQVGVAAQGELGLALRTHGGPALTIGGVAHVSPSPHWAVRTGGRAAIALVTDPARPAFVNGRVQNGTFFVGGGAQLTESTCFSCVEGRPFRGASGLQRPQALDPDGRPVDSDGPARTWLETARDELAAVAAFVRLARELEAAGAPAHLVRAAERAADEEVEHASMCLERAAFLLGHPVRLTGMSAPTPRAFASRSEALATLRRESLEDGVDNEGRAALRAAERAERAGDDAEVAIHLRIAREETGHAELGQAIADWARAA